MTHAATPKSLKLLAPTEFKLAGNTGQFEGYCARFGNVDDGGDLIVAGAFVEFAHTRDGKLLVLYQHSARDIIGSADVAQDSKGLHVRGQLVLDDPVAARAYTLMKAGTLDAMSVGYNVLEGGESYKNGVRTLSRLKAWEASIVPWGMNTLARIETVKSAMDCEHPSELQDLLRDTLLLSNRKAKAAASAMWPILSGDKPGAEDDAEIRPELKAQIARILSTQATLTGR